MDEISVAADDTLWIQPGVTVRFMGFYKLEVYGTLLAVGAEGDSIVFTSGQPFPAPNDWQSIDFFYSTSSGSMIYYSKIQYGREGINFVGSGSAAFISNNSIKWNSQHGIAVHQSSSSAVIQNNKICHNNHSGIRCAHSSADIYQNIISNNYLGIELHTSSSEIRNNIISDNNSRGIYCANGSTPNIKTTILFIIMELEFMPHILPPLFNRTRSATTIATG
jgi:parallel beta-helix repeat protein